MRITSVKHTRFIAGLIVIAFAVSCGSGGKKPGSADNGIISISGAFALYPMTSKWAEEFQKQYPKIRIDISAGGAGKGMTDALAGMVDLGMFSREVSEAEAARGAWKIAVTKDAVLCTIHSDNPALAQLKSRGMKKAHFQRIFLSDTAHNWNEIYPEVSADMHVFTRSDACGAAEIWGKYLGKNQESLKGIGVFGDPGMADAVKKDRLGISYNNVCYAYDAATRKKLAGIEIVPIDVNEDGRITPDENIYETLDQVMAGIADGRYPSPPARPLYFVAHGKPEKKEVILFLKWILTKGQEYVGEAGYVQLSPDMIREQLTHLEN
ncbi:MAG: PstS family phosphate ABC transporter substrate-binding protein [Bacteroidia bacterium]|nr:PstS family phosphate ABC transporter substrate-binding protein [Bacteroidia bacterium]